MLKKMLYIAVLLTLIGSCSKERSKGWIVIDLNAKSARTGLPVDLEELYFEYSEKGESNEKVRKELDIEASTTEGKLYVEVPILKGDDDFVLKYKTDTYYMPYDADENTFIGFHALSKKELNEFDILLEPRTFSTKLILNNLSCFDETDSMWIANFVKGEWSDETLYTGCIEDILYRFNEDTRLLTERNDLKLKVRTKKDGTDDSFEVDYVLLPEIVNELRLDY